MPSLRTVLFSVLVGIVHAATLLAVAMHLGYSVGPSHYTAVGAAWRYTGLVVVAAVPVALAVRYRIVAPLAALLLTTGYVLGMELTPPGPTFHDVAELEPSVQGPTGITVVENGLYVVRYMINASVWTVGFLLLGVVEYAVRTAWEALPSVREPPRWLPIPASRRRAAAVAAGFGLLHAGVMAWFASRLGVSVSGGGAWALYLFGTAGMWLLAAVPVHLLVRRRLVSPALTLAFLVLSDVRSEFTAGVEDPHALYFGAWFAFLAVILVVAGVEYGLRRVDISGRLS